MVKLVDRLQMIIRGELPRAPMFTLLGIKLTSVQPGHVVAEYEFNEQHKTLDALNIGVLCAMAEIVMGNVYNITLEERAIAPMVEMKINFLKPVRKGKLQAIGKLLKGGQTIGLVECDILDDGQQLIAHAVGTCMKLESK